MAHLGDSPGESGSAATALLEELLAGGMVGEHELVVRAGLAGLHPQPGTAVVGVVADAPDPVTTGALIRAAAAAGGPGVLTGRVRGQVLAIVMTDPEESDPAGALVNRMRELMDHDGGEQVPQTARLDGVPPAGHLHAAVGPPVPLADAGRSLREAHAAAQTVWPGDAPGVGRGIRTWRETVPDRILGLLDDEARAHLVDDLLGPLRRWDAAHGSDLVRTVEVFLRHGCSPTRAAAVLHLRRQSLHQRLNRAEHLLGHRIDEPGSVAAMLLAARAAHPSSLQ